MIAVQILHPLKIGNEYSTGICENVGNESYPRPFENLVRHGSRGTVCSFDDYFCLDLGRVAFRNLIFESCGNYEIRFCFQHFFIRNLLDVRNLADRPELVGSLEQIIEKD